MKKHNYKQIASLLILVVIVGWYYHQRSVTVMPKVRPPTVTTLKIKPVVMPQKVEAIGTLSAKSVVISPEVAGHVVSINVPDGVSVKAGATILQLDNKIYQAKLISAKAQLTYSKDNYDRMVLLGKQGAIAKQAIEQASADYKQRQAEVEEDQVMLDKMQLTAPFDGVIGKVNVSPGDYVTTGQSLVSITDTSHLHIEYTIPEAYYPQLKLGQHVKISSSTYPGQTFDGSVAFISPVINQEGRSIQLYADIPNEHHELAPGMLVNIQHQLNDNLGGVFIPAKSLVSALDGQIVYKVIGGNVYSAPVKTGVRVDDLIQITDGLAFGDVIVTDGQIKLKNNMPVSIGA